MARLGSPGHRCCDSGHGSPLQPCKYLGLIMSDPQPRTFKFFKAPPRSGAAPALCHWFQNVSEEYFAGANRGQLWPSFGPFECCRLIPNTAASRGLPGTHPECEASETPSETPGCILLWQLPLQQLQGILEKKPKLVKGRSHTRLFSGTWCGYVVQEALQVASNHKASAVLYRSLLSSVLWDVLKHVETNK